MKMVKAPVKSARKSKLDEKGNKVRTEVGTAEYPEYDTVDEARHALSDGVVLKLVNAQVATNAKNNVRAEAVGTPSEKALISEAFSRLTGTAEGMARLAAVQGDTTRMQALISEVVEELKKEKGIAKPADDAEDGEEADA